MVLLQHKSSLLIVNQSSNYGNKSEPWQSKSEYWLIHEASFESIIDRLH
jgi:hypothetical protein